MVNSCSTEMFCQQSHMAQKGRTKGSTEARGSISSVWRGVNDHMVFTVINF